MPNYQYFVHDNSFAPTVDVRVPCVSPAISSLDLPEQNQDAVPDPTYQNQQVENLSPALSKIEIPVHNDLAKPSGEDVQENLGNNFDSLAQNELLTNKNHASTSQHSSLSEKKKLKPSPPEMDFAVKDAGTNTSHHSFHNREKSGLHLSRTDFGMLHFSYNKPFPEQEPFINHPSFHDCTFCQDFEPPSLPNGCDCAAEQLISHMALKGRLRDGNSRPRRMQASRPHPPTTPLVALPSTVPSSEKEPELEIPIVEELPEPVPPPEPHHMDADEMNSYVHVILPCVVVGSSLLFFCGQDFIQVVERDIELLLHLFPGV